MAAPRVLVLRAPGTNCDHETAHAFARCGAVAERLHLFRLLEQPALLGQAQILCIPGGFSYGDDVGAGAIFGTHLRTRLADGLRSFVDAGKLVLGICNGFQVLMRSGLLPSGVSGQTSAEATAPEATLTWNASGRYTDRWVHTAVPETRCVFLNGLSRLDLPVAHAEGRIVPRSSETVATWRAAGQIALQYADPKTGTTADDTLPAPLNPNGSYANIAGLCDPTGRVFGLMPHPERHMDATQHPQWTRRDTDPAAEGDGLAIFRNGVRYFA
jgi:phosphoribosylformylglycinamidine synthase subunit PurQ / glutaminase